MSRIIKNEGEAMFTLRADEISVYRLSVIGLRRNGYQPYVRIGHDPNSIMVCSFSGDDQLRALRDALTKALRK